MEDSDLFDDKIEVVSHVNESIECAKLDEDYRIPCNNHSSLDMMLQIAVKHVEKTAQSLASVENRKLLVTRFTEVFREALHSNVSVSGLPWSVNQDLLPPTLAKQQAAETDDVLLSMAARSVEGLARKRSTYPAECAKICEMKFKHQRVNLKKLEIPHAMPSFVIPKAPETFPHEELSQVFRDLLDTQTKINQMSEEFPELQRNVEIAQDILNRQTMNDTGYMSE